MIVYMCAIIQNTKALIHDRIFKNKIKQFYDMINLFECIIVRASYMVILFS